MSFWRLAQMNPIQGLPGLQSEFKAHLNESVRPCLRYKVKRELRPYLSGGAVDQHERSGAGGRILSYIHRVPVL